MAEFFYQIKGKDQFGVWQWPPMIADKITADDKNHAKTLIQDMYDKIFKRGKDADLLLHIREIIPGDTHFSRLFEDRQCQNCGKGYQLIEKYTYGNPGGGSYFCSSDCSSSYNKLENYSRGYGTQKPLIYKITNKTTGMCYIGKTTQVFTLRWYQHFFQGTDTKFHAAIKTSDVTEWSFEILEVLQFPEGCTSAEAAEIILKKETEYINQYNSIEKGYNTVKSKAEVIRDLNQINIPFEIAHGITKEELIDELKEASKV